MLSRVLFSACLLSALLISTVLAQPQLFCSPAQVNVFSVVASTTGGSDSEGNQLGTANGVYGVFYYYIPLARAYNNHNIFFNVHVAPQLPATPNLLSYGFTIRLNDVFHTAVGFPNVTAGGTSNTFFNLAPNSSVDVSNIEFTNWLYDTALKSATNNTLIVNVTESTLVSDGQGNQDEQDCHFVYNFIFTNPAPATIVGDPQFIGLRGQNYQVHGIDGQVYNLISAPTLNVNSRFVFLNHGACPVLGGVAQSNCWSHPGSYLGSVGIQQIVNGKAQQLEIVSGGAKQGFELIALNGEPVAVGGQVRVGDELVVSYLSTHKVDVRTPLFHFVFESSDHFINQQLTALLTMSELGALDVHGLLGQTHKRRVYETPIRYIEGDVDDYTIEDGALFGVNFLHNRFNL